MRHHIYLTALILPLAIAQSPSPIPFPGQPTHKGETGKFELLENSIVSSQQVKTPYCLVTFCILTENYMQLFLGRPDKVYIIDKVENNPTQINGHPAWASGTLQCFTSMKYFNNKRSLILTEYRLSDNHQRPLDIATNTFCAVSISPSFLARC